MTTEQFTYWLQGFMEVANPTVLDKVQVQQIKDHLNLVFDKQTPSIQQLHQIQCQFGRNLIQLYQDRV